MQSLRHAALRPAAIEPIPRFLAHRFPTVRMSTSEQILFLLQAEWLVNESLEECLLNTAWCVHRQTYRRASESPTVLAGPAAEVAEALQRFS